jgi:hypothetical protein
MLKHDLRSVWRVWRIIAPILLVSALLCGFAIRVSNLIGFEEMDPLTLWATQLIPFFGAIASVAYMVSNPIIWFATQLMNTLPMVFFIITLVLILARYYKNFFTDEGYLTFTLPVSRTKLLNSKIIMTFFWLILTVVGCGIAYILFLVCSTDRETWSQIFQYYYGSGSSDLPATETNWQDFWFNVVYILGFLIGSVASVVSNILIMLTSITLGATIVKRAKFVLGVGIYVLSTYVMSIFAFAAMFVTVQLLSQSESNTDIFNLSGVATVWLSAMLFIGLGVGAYLLNKKLINKHLNLP